MDEQTKLTRRMDVYLLMLDMESDRFTRLDLAEVGDAIAAHEARYPQGEEESTCR